MNGQSSCLSLSVRIPIAWPSSLAKRFYDIGEHIVGHSLLCVIIRCYSGLVCFISRIVQMLNIFAILRCLYIERVVGQSYKLSQRLSQQEQNHTHRTRRFYDLAHTGKLVKHSAALQRHRLGTGGRLLRSYNCNYQFEML